jgi:hypothetical protein
MFQLDFALPDEGTLDAFHGFLHCGYRREMATNFMFDYP